MDLGTYLDGQQRLMAAGYVLTYSGAGANVYAVTATKAGQHPVTVYGMLTGATYILAGRLAPGAR